MKHLLLIAGGAAVAYGLLQSRQSTSLPSTSQSHIGIAPPIVSSGTPASAGNATLPTATAGAASHVTAPAPAPVHVVQAPHSANPGIVPPPIPLAPQRQAQPVIVSHPFLLAHIASEPVALRSGGTRFAVMER